MQILFFTCFHLIYLENPNQDEVLERFKQMKRILIIKVLIWNTFFKLLLTQWVIFT